MDEKGEQTIEFPPMKVMLWSLQALWTLVVSIAFLWINGQSQSIDNLETKVAALSSTSAEGAANIKNLEAWLSRIESKLDRAISENR